VCNGILAAPALLWCKFYEWISSKVTLRTYSKLPRIYFHLLQAQFTTVQTSHCACMPPVMKFRSLCIQEQEYTTPHVTRPWSSKSQPKLSPSYKTRVGMHVLLKYLLDFLLYCSILLHMSIISKCHWKTISHATMFVEVFQSHYIFCSICLSSDNRKGQWPSSFTFTIYHTLKIHSTLVSNLFESPRHINYHKTHYCI
jgi:hypothetical protein